MPSFDIVSEIDAVELRNAVENSTRELASRFDFRNVDASFELKEETVKLAAEDDFRWIFCAVISPNAVWMLVR